MDTGAKRNRHRQRRLDTCDGFHGDGVSHAHARTEIGIGDALGRYGLEQCAHHRIATGIPAGGHYRNSATAFCHHVERLHHIGYRPMNVETIDRADALTQQPFGQCGHLAAWRTQNGHIDRPQSLDVGNYIHLFQLARNNRHRTAYHTCHLQIGRSLQGFKRGLAHVAITYDGYSFFLHKSLFLSAKIRQNNRTTSAYTAFFYQQLPANNQKRQKIW